MQGGELERHPSLSDRRDPAISVVPYDPEWVGEFEREAAAIRDALSGVLVRIEHVGSTAVPGLPAKPIIDIQVSVGNIRQRDSFVLPLRRDVAQADGVGPGHGDSSPSGSCDSSIRTRTYRPAPVRPYSKRIASAGTPTSAFAFAARQSRNRVSASGGSNDATSLGRNPMSSSSPATGQL